MSFTIEDIMLNNIVDIKNPKQLRYYIVYYNNTPAIELRDNKGNIINLFNMFAPFTTLEKYGITLSIPIKLAEVLYK